MILIYNAATRTSLPHFITITTYHLGELHAERLPQGYFVRVSGLTKAQIERLRSGISAQVRAGSSNESWNNMVENLTGGLAKHSDLKLACQDPKCEYTYDLFKRAIREGFSMPGSDQMIKTDFYTIDRGSLKVMVASAKRSKAAGVTGNAIYIGTLGLSAGATLYAAYQMLAMATGLPRLPTPF